MAIYKSTCGIRGLSIPSGPLYDKVTMRYALEGEQPTWPGDANRIQIAHVGAVAALTWLVWDTFVHIDNEVQFLAFDHECTVLRTTDRRSDTYGGATTAERRCDCAAAI